MIYSTQSVSSFVSFPIRPISMRRKEQTDRKIWGFAFKEVSSKAGADCTACFLALTGSVPCAQWFRLLLEYASVGKLHCTISQAGIPSRRKGLWSSKSLNVSCLDRYLGTWNTFCIHMKETKPKWSSGSLKNYVDKTGDFQLWWMVKKRDARTLALSIWFRT